MTDGLFLGVVKRGVRRMWALELGSRRLLARSRWELRGSCQGCGSCCERPSIRVDAVVWFLPMTRRAFLAWHRHVNGFELVGTERSARTFVFRCTHFDAVTRRCDSYATRPHMCQDYPRVLLDQAWPELFTGCGFRVRDREGVRLADALDEADLSSEQREELKKRLRVD
ncbi:MAG: YkgJ family cysteine cluster protein [Proteobacteria bacterium]|nr:YkgJ family cysteine cluster protein [Pseudomonadota bacterium]MCP4919051.1 YkgJ family cysteine cluster protein [Pseudomonadota bacterium]